MRTARGLLAAVLAAVAVLPACGGGADAADTGDGTSDGTARHGSGVERTTTTVLGSGDGTYEVRQETFTDPSRPTGEVPGRVLPTDIYVPGGDGPFPLIVHAHGMDGSSAKFSKLLGRWAEQGHVVVAPNFPLTNDAADPPVSAIADYVNQPADVRFVLDRVLEQTRPGGPLEGLVATDRIGISGLSLGGATTYPLVFHPCCRDERFSAALLMSALELPFEGGEYDWTLEVPTLAFAGTADTSISYDLQRSTVEKLTGPMWFVTLEGGSHAAPFEDQDSPHDALVEAATAEFWAATLRGDRDALERIAAAAEVPGLSRVDRWHRDRG